MLAQEAVRDYIDKEESSELDTSRDKEDKEEDKDAEVDIKSRNATMQPISKLQ